MITSTTAGYLAKSYAGDRARDAARDRRLAPTGSTPRADGPRPDRFTAAARIAARLVWPFRHEVAAR